MIKKIIFPVLLLISLAATAQVESSQYIHKFLVRADASIVPGFMFVNNLSNVYINGNLEYYMDNKVSVRGDATYMMGSSGLSADSIGLKDNHSILLGPVFHFKTNSHLDPYFIIQPGIAYTSSYRGSKTGNTDTKHLVNYPGVLSPIGTAGFGMNYYFQRFAHLFIEARYVYGNHLSDAPHPLSLQEMRITFGLGFNVFVAKEKKSPS